jgi:hypothetical protein
MGIVEETSNVNNVLSFFSFSFDFNSGLFLSSAQYLNLKRQTTSRSAVKIPYTSDHYLLHKSTWLSGYNKPPVIINLVGFGLFVKPNSTAVELCFANQIVLIKVIGQ